MVLKSVILSERRPSGGPRRIVSVLEIVRCILRLRKHGTPLRPHMPPFYPTWLCAKRLTTFKKPLLPEAVCKATVSMS